MCRDRFWPDPNDEADGQGALVRAPLVWITARSPEWMRFAGPWGGARAGWVPGEEDSPRGPAFQPQGRWSDPSGWARAARSCTRGRCASVGACDGAEMGVWGGGVVAGAVVGGAGFWLARQAPPTRRAPRRVISKPLPVAIIVHRAPRRVARQR